jgi:hypothetical protein
MATRLQPSDVVAAFLSSVQDPKKRLDQDYREMALRDLVTMLESNTATRAGFTLDREEKLVSEILALLLRDASMDVRQHAVKAVVLLFMFVSSASQDSICDKAILMLGERDDKVAASDHGPSPSLMRDAATLTLKGILSSLAAAQANSESVSRPAFFLESHSKLISRVIPCLRGMVHSSDKANADMMLKALEVLNEALRLPAVAKGSNHSQLLTRSNHALHARARTHTHKYTHAHAHFHPLHHPPHASHQPAAAAPHRQSCHAQGSKPLHLRPRPPCV